MFGYYASLLRCFCLFAIEQALQFLQHSLNIVERAVDAGETDVGDLVHALEILHYQFSNDAAWKFQLALPVKLLLDLLDGFFDLLNRHWSFFACLTDAYEELLPVKCFSPLVPFNNHELRFLDALIGAEASFALFAFAPPVYSVSHVARILHARFRASAKRAFHETASSPPIFCACRVLQCLIFNIFYHQKR